MVFGDRHATLTRLVVPTVELLTLHREANVTPEPLARIAEALAEIGEPVIFPAHPRTSSTLAQAGIALPPNVAMIPPAGYLDFAALASQARVVLTDSGGVQKEAYFLRVPCVTLRDETEWPETLAGGWNELAGADPARILASARRDVPAGDPPDVFGDGHAAEKMVAALERDPA